MRVVGADEVHLVALHALEAHPDVGLDVLHDVADVERRVGVGQGGGDEELARCGHGGFQTGAQRGHLSTCACRANCTLHRNRNRAHADSESAVSDALQAVIDPNTGKDFVSTKQLKNLQVDGGDVSFDVELGYPAKSQIAGAAQGADRGRAQRVPGVANVSVNLTQQDHRRTRCSAACSCCPR